MNVRELEENLESRMRESILGEIMRRFEIVAEITYENKPSGLRETYYNCPSGESQANFEDG